MRRRFTSGRVLLCLAGLCLLGLVFAIYHKHYRWKWAADRYKHQLRTQGEELTLQEFLRAGAPTEHNSAGLLQQAMYEANPGGKLLDKIAPVPMRMIDYGKAVPCARQEAPGARDGMTNSWEEIEAQLAWSHDVLETLGQIIEQPTLDFQLDYRQGYSLLLPHLAPLKRASQLLTWRALCDLHQSRPEAAAQQLRTVVALAQGMEGEPLTISQSVRMSIASLGVAGTWELLQADSVSEAQLEPLQRAWSGLDFRHAGERSLAFERAFAEMILERMLQNDEAFQQYLQMSGVGFGSPSSATAPPMLQSVIRGTISGSAYLHWRFAWAYPDEFRGLRGSQVLIETFREARSLGCWKPALDRQERRLKELGFKSIREDRLAGRFNPASLRSLFSDEVARLRDLAPRVVQTEQARDLAVTAIAVRRYELRHGARPRELAALVPEFLPAVTADPIDGQRLRYRLKEDGTFLLYSIGDDGEDNGGDPSPKTPAQAEGKARPSYGWREGRDFVWPQPASDTEGGGSRKNLGPRER